MWLGVTSPQVLTSFRLCCFFFFQAEDGIRDYKVTGVQTCALPISATCWEISSRATEEISQQVAAIQEATKGAVNEIGSIGRSIHELTSVSTSIAAEIGRASCRERGWSPGERPRVTEKPAQRGDR